MSSISTSQMKRLAGRRLVLSVSGGKDSAAAALSMLEAGLDFESVFADTGWEAPETYRYLRDVLPRYIGPIRWLVPPRQMEDLVLRKGMFPSRPRRFCTQELKVVPIQNYLDSLEEEPVNVVGIRAEESLSRAQLPEFEWNQGFKCETWRPIISWNEAQVIDIHKRHGLPPNPLYLRGHKRVGCFPCINATKEDIRLVATHAPERIDKIRELERLVNEAAKIRATAKGETVPATRGWFQARLPGEAGASWPIDKVTKWARTSHGGRQYELFGAPSSQAGCARWGLCDTKGDVSQ